MESSFSLDLGMNTTRLETLKTATNRTLIDIQKAIDDQFGEEIRTFTGTRYSGSQTRPKSSRRKVIQISNRWTKTAKTPVSITSPPGNPQKARFTLGVRAGFFLSGTASMVSDTNNDQEPRDDNTTVCSETQSFLHQQKKKLNRCKPTPRMRH